MFFTKKLYVCDCFDHILIFFTFFRIEKDGHWKFAKSCPIFSPWTPIWDYFVHFWMMSVPKQPTLKLKSGLSDNSRSHIVIYSRSIVDNSWQLTDINWQFLRDNKWQHVFNVCNVNYLLCILETYILNESIRQWPQEWALHCRIPDGQESHGSSWIGKVQPGLNTVAWFFLTFLSNVT